MSKGSSSITPNQYAFIIIGFILQIAILSLPGDVGEISLQDSWISVLLGGLYPVYLALLGLYVSKKYPNDNVLTLSERYFGKYIGRILNLLFVFFFFTVMVSTVSGMTNLYRVYAVNFLKPIKVMALITILSMYAAYCGLKVVGKISEITFYLTIIIALIPLFSIGKGSLLNVQPVGGSGIINIFKGSIKTILAYSGVEVMFLIYPYVNNKKDLKKATWLAIAIIIGIYTWFTFMTVFYLDPETTLKRLWPFLSVTEGLRIPIINNFRYFFLLLWSLAIFKALSIVYYLIVLILKDTFKIKKQNRLYFVLFPLIIGVAILIPNEVYRRTIITYFAYPEIIFNLIFLTTITMFVALKG